MNTNVFYVVDGQRYFSTLEAWHQINSGAQSWRLSLFEDCFDNLTWSADPVESFDQLITKRIDSIASKYKKIRLWYSAGRDSHFILKEFVKRKVKIDELIYIHWHNMDLFRHEDSIVSTAVNDVYKDSGMEIPTFKIFRANREEQTTYWKNVATGKISAGVGCNLGFSHNSTSAIIDSFSQFQDPDYCNLIGLEKPRLAVKNNQVYYQITDLSIVQSWSNRHNTEWFFLNDSVPELVVKQTHMLLNGAKILAAQNKCTLEEAINLLQFNNKLYDRLCLVLGLGPAYSAQTGDGSVKWFGISDQRYANPINLAKSDSWDAYHHYKEFRTNIEYLIKGYANEQQGNKLVGIVSKPYLVSNC